MHRFSLFSYFSPGESIDKAARSDIPYCHALRVGIIAYLMIRLERHIETVNNLMKLIVGVFRGYPCLFLIVIFIEMGLDRHHPVLLVDRKRLHPRMVGSGHIDRTETGTQSQHNRRNQHVTRSWHSGSRAVGPMTEPPEALDRSRIVTAQTDVRMTGNGVQAVRFDRGGHKQRHLPIHCRQIAPQRVDILIGMAEKMRVCQYVIVWSPL